MINNSGERKEEPLTSRDNVDHVTTGSSGYGKLFRGFICELNKRVVIFLNFVAVRDAKNDRSSGSCIFISRVVSVKGTTNFRT